jgi:predicted AAA+ superfamily ATPase
MAERVAAGGYPAALTRATARRRTAWYRDYADTLIQRDIRDLARISEFDALPRLMMMAAGQTACLVNVSELAAPFQVSRQTIRDYVTLLSRIFLLEELPAWHNNRLSRLIKTPEMACGRHRPGLFAAWLDGEMVWKDRHFLVEFSRPLSFRSAQAGKLHEETYTSVFFASKIG